MYQILVLLVSAAVVTPAAVLSIPHARHSPAFARLLWAATFVMAFLGASLGPRYLGALAPEAAVEGVPLLPPLIGAAFGALALHLILGLLDRFEPPVEDQSFEEEETEDETIPEDALTDEVNDTR